MAKQITKIPATISKLTKASLDSKEKRKVAAYARVSTDQEEQLTSYEAQVDYYTNYIKSREDWEFVSVFTDEGITGTSTKHREGFKKMIAEALAGNIDLIVTKSVSRFARNTVDSLSTIRKLKEHGTEVYFEKENIWTFDSKGELLITIMSSLAQEESRSISENVTWGHRKRFADGKLMVPYSNLLGYEKGEDGNLAIVEDQAAVVRRIYRLFLQGHTPYTIAKQLTKDGIPTPMKKKEWNAQTIKHILTNEKFKGDALLQKTITVDFLTKKHKPNEGEAPQYYVEDNHEGIVSKEVFEAVQHEIERRNGFGTRYSGTGIFASKIICADCGSYFGSKVWHSNDKYRKVIYRCNRKYKDEEKCTTPALSEEEIKDAFIRAVNQLLSNKKAIISDVSDMRKMLCDNTQLEEERQKLLEEMSLLVETIEDEVDRNAHVAQNQKRYEEKYLELVNKYETAKRRADELSEKISDNNARSETLGLYIRTLKSQDVITEFDDAIWGSLVESATVRAKDDITFKFKDGTEISV